MMGSDPGVTAELNGGTHMSMEDVSIMRNIPGMIIYEPVDSMQLKQIFPQILAVKSPVYIRLLRRNAVKVFDESYKFVLGEGTVISEGTDISIFATGIMVAEAVEACEELKKEGVSAEVINIHTIKPLDAKLVIESAKKTGAVVVAENHSVIGGLYSAVAETLSAACPVPAIPVGVKDHFGEVGSTALPDGEIRPEIERHYCGGKTGDRAEKIIQIQKRGKQDEILFRQRQIG